MAVGSTHIPIQVLSEMVKATGLCKGPRSQGIDRSKTPWGGAAPAFHLREGSAGRQGWDHAHHAGHQPARDDFRQVFGDLASACIALESAASFDHENQQHSSGSHMKCPGSGSVCLATVRLLQKFLEPRTLPGRSSGIRCSRHVPMLFVL